MPQTACVCLVIQLCPTLCDPVDCSPSDSSVHGDSQGKNTGVGCHAPPLQAIFPTQESNAGIPHCRWIVYCLSHQGGRSQTAWSYPWFYPLTAWHVFFWKFPYIFWNLSYLFLSHRIPFPLYKHWLKTFNQWLCCIFPVNFVKFPEILSNFWACVFWCKGSCAVYQQRNRLNT